MQLLPEGIITAVLSEGHNATDTLKASFIHPNKHLLAVHNVPETIGLGEAAEGWVAIL